MQDTQIPDQLAVLGRSSSTQGLQQMAERHVDGVSECRGEHLKNGTPVSEQAGS